MSAPRMMLAATVAWLLAAPAAVAAEPAVLTPGKKTPVSFNSFAPSKLRFTAKAGDRIQLDLRVPGKEAREMSLLLHALPDEAKVPVENFDLLSGDGRRIRTRLTRSGEYLVSARCGSCSEGELTFTVVTPRAERVASAQKLPWVRGVLHDGDALSDEAPFGHLIEAWTFTGEAGKTVSLLLDSAGAQDHLELRRPGDFPVRLAHDPKSNQWTATLPVSGEYTAEVHLVKEGHYFLMFTEDGVYSRGFDTFRLIPGEPEQGTLDDDVDGPSFLHGIVYFDGRAQQKATLRYTVAAGIPHLALYRTFGTGEETVSELVGADYGPTADGEATVSVTLPLDSRYYVVTAADMPAHKPGGAYSLTLDLQMPPTRKVEIPAEPKPKSAPVASRDDDEEDEDEDEDDEAPNLVVQPRRPAARAYRPNAYFGAVFEVEGGALSNELAGGLKVELIPGVRVTSFICLEAAASVGFAINASAMVVNGLAGPSLRFGEAGRLSARITGGLGWAVALNGTWGAGPAGRVEVAPWGRGLNFSLEAQTSPLTTTFLVGFGGAVYAGD